MKKQIDVLYIHDQLAKLDDRLDTVDQLLHSLDKTAALQQASLDEHMKRTALLEDALKPVKKAHETVQSIATLVIKFVAACGAVVAIWAAFKR